MRTVALGGPLTPEDVVGVAREGFQVSFPEEAERRVARGRAFVDRLADGDALVYGITTGVGKLKDVRIPAEDRRALQLNLLRSHAAGLGPAMTAAESRAMWCCLAASLARGHSGVRPALVRLLAGCLNRGVTPVVPEWGSLGASGDLIPLAHAALVLVGEGEAWVDGRRLPGRAALAAAGLAPLGLEAKEGLALLNGTHQMAGVGALVLDDAAAALRVADVTGCMSLEALMGTNSAADPRIHALRAHAGQVAAAANVRRLTAASGIIASHADCHRVQDAYSLRCLPQVHGASREAHAFARAILVRELQSVTDNPLVFPDDEQVLTGGNFHGQPLALAFDALAIGLGYLAGIAERRIDRLVNPLVSELPAFLAADAGLQSGYMLAQVQAAALASEVKTLGHPASADSIPTSGNQEDFVPMGGAAVRKCREVLRRVRAVLAIEAVCAAQALDCRAPLEPGRGSAAARAALRARVPRLLQDRPLAEEFTAAVALIEDGSLLGAVETAVGPLD
ncbi:MAG: histidine ammonia-lyase [Candidatus Rokubacteria bacterium]|nr:histidine ammonia-lyase [Candidatus Rokubacteria bacterium]